MAVTDTRFVRGAEKLGQRIRTLRANLALPAMVDEIGNLLLRRTQDRFKRQVDPDGNAWVPLAPSTLATKLRLGFGSKGKLRRTDKLFKSIKLVKSSVSGSIFTNTGAGVRIGIEDPDMAVVGRVHNSGTGRIPQRRFLGIGALDIKSVDSFMRRKGQKVVE